MRKVAVRKAMYLKKDQRSIDRFDRVYLWVVSCRVDPLSPIICEGEEVEGAEDLRVSAWIQWMNSIESVKLKCFEICTTTVILQGIYPPLRYNGRKCIPVSNWVNRRPFPSQWMENTLHSQSKEPDSTGHREWRLWEEVYHSWDYSSMYLKWTNYTLWTTSRRLIAYPILDSS